MDNTNKLILNDVKNKNQIRYSWSLRLMRQWTKITHAYVQAKSYNQLPRNHDKTLDLLLSFLFKIASTLSSGADFEFLRSSNTSSEPATYSKPIICSDNHIKGKLHNFTSKSQGWQLAEDKI